MARQVKHEEGGRHDDERLGDAVLAGVAHGHLLGVHVADRRVDVRRGGGGGRCGGGQRRLMAHVHVVQLLVLGRVEHDVDDLRVHHEDDDERHEQRDDAVDVAGDCEQGVVAGQVGAHAAAVSQHDHRRGPQREGVGDGGDDGEGGDDDARPPERAPRVAVQRVADDDEPFDGERDDVPDAEEAEHVREVHEQLAQALRVEQRHVQHVEPRHQQRQQEAAVGERERRQVHVAGERAQRRAAEDAERQRVADEADDDDDGHEERVEVAQYVVQQRRPVDDVR